MHVCADAVGSAARVSKESPQITRWLKGSLADGGSSPARNRGIRSATPVLLVAQSPRPPPPGRLSIGRGRCPFPAKALTRGRRLSSRPRRAIPGLGVNHTDDPESARSETGASLRAEGVGDYPGVAHSLGRPPTGSIEKRAGVPRRVVDYADAQHLQGLPVITVASDRPARYRHADQLRAKRGADAELVTPSGSGMAMETRHKGIGLAQGRRNDVQPSLSHSDLPRRRRWGYTPARNRDSDVGSDATLAALLERLLR
jgi:hypothetical protein